MVGPGGGDADGVNAPFGLAVNDNVGNPSVCRMRNYPLVGCWIVGRGLRRNLEIY